MPKQGLQLILIAITVLVMFNFLKSMFSPVNNVQLKQHIKNGALLVDVRTAAEFSNGSVKGAVNIPLDKVAGQLSKFKDKKSIIVFCRSGNRSRQAKNILEQNGIKNVINGGTWKNVAQVVNE